MRRIMNTMESGAATIFYSAGDLDAIEREAARQREEQPRARGLFGLRPGRAQSTAAEMRGSLDHDAVPNGAEKVGGVSAKPPAVLRNFLNPSGRTRKEFSAEPREEEKIIKNVPALLQRDIEAQERKRVEQDMRSARAREEIKARHDREMKQRRQAEEAKRKGERDGAAVYQKLAEEKHLDAVRTYWGAPPRIEGPFHDSLVLTMPLSQRERRMPEVRTQILFGRSISSEKIEAAARVRGNER